KRGIRMPILVMSPIKSAFESMIKNQLEPEIYSIRVLSEFVEVARGMRHFFNELTIHLKIDSGMHRLGFQTEDIPHLIDVLSQTPFIKVGSVFTHLSAADNQTEDDFSRQQVTSFQKIASA